MRRELEMARKSRIASVGNTGETPRKASLAQVYPTSRRRAKVVVVAARHHRATARLTGDGEPHKIYLSTSGFNSPLFGILGPDVIEFIPHEIEAAAGGIADVGRGCDHTR